MSIDVVDLRNFYAQRLGVVARRFVGRGIRKRLADTRGMRVLGVGYPTPYLGLFREEAERNLGSAMPEIARIAEQFKQERNYSRALAEISRLRPAVDAFFDKVMVMVEDEQLRANRLALLRSLLKEFSTIADFSEIVTEGKQ